MTLREYTDCMTANLEPLYGPRESRAIVFMVMEEMCAISRIDIALNPHQELVETESLKHSVRRLLSGEPVQYVVGHAWFCDMKFGVDPAVLIPRPETQELVEWIVDDISGDGSVAILDIGTGSGCIAVCLAAKLPAATVTAIDLSTEALGVAARNARLNGADVEFILQDALQDTALWDKALIDSKYSVIVSNPPYVPLTDRPGMAAHVAEYEPAAALFPQGDDPLVFYRATADNGLELLESGGRLYFEVYSDFAPLVCDILDKAGYADIIVREDMNSKPRMVRCTKR